MDGRDPERSRLKRVHDAYLRHRNVLAYSHVAFIVVAYVVGSRFEAVGRAMLVPAVFSLILLVVETIAHLDTTVKEKMTRLETSGKEELTRVETTLGEGLARLERTVTRFFQPEFAAGTLAEDAILKLVDVSKAEVTTIDIIAATGGSNMPFLRGLSDRAELRTIRLNLYLVDPDPEIPPSVPMPRHWKKETENTLDCLRDEFEDSQLDVNVYLYAPPPSIRAILVDHQDLLLGFFRWRRRPAGGKPVFAGAGGPHRLYRKGDPDASHYIDVVEDWLLNAPKRQVLPTPSKAGGPSIT